MNEDSRRHFLKNTVRTASGLIIGASALEQIACGGSGGSPTGPSTPPPVARDVTRSYLVQDTDGNRLGEFTTIHTQGKENITPAYLQSKGIHLSGVDTNYFALNQDFAGESFGRQIGSTRAGSLPVQYTADGHGIVTFLRGGIDWTGAFATGGAGYGPGFGNGVPAQDISIRQMLAGEKSGQPGDYLIVDGTDQPIIQSIEWLSDIFTIGNNRLLRLNYSGRTQTPATLKTGYYPSTYGSNGYHGKDYAIVNDSFLSAPRFYSTANRFMFVELAEVIGGFDDLYGKNSAPALMNVDNTPSASATPILRAAALFGLPK